MTGGHGADRYPAIHPAATILLLRERQSELEILMMRRAAAVSFMGGMWVFPGGRLDTADCAPRAVSRVAQPAVAHCLARIGSGARAIAGADQAVGLYIAACREMFEESGVLLARDAQGRCCDAARAAALQSRRKEITTTPAAFIPMLEDGGLFIEADQFIYWSRWITPSAEKKRFDTHFFATEVEADQDVSADLSELTEHTWIRPRDALLAAERGDMRMVPPTLLTLEDLQESFSRHRGVSAMLAAERERPVPPIMPRIVSNEAAVRIVMPWDPQYPEIDGDGCPLYEVPPHFANRRSHLSMSRSARDRPEKKAPG